MLVGVRPDVGLANEPASPAARACAGACAAEYADVYVDELRFLAR